MNSEKLDNPLLLKVDKATPKLSIGMPVYNGERLICRALDSLLAQTFADFELIISDNASTDATGAVCREYAKRDARIRYHRQQINRGTFDNFNFVLEQANANFFMWAAHDDAWDKCFIEKIMRTFELLDCSVVAIASEAQYTINTEKQIFFPEGEAFYNTGYFSAFDRIKNILNNNYGNLFYSIYRTACLYVDGKTLLSPLNQISLNEIPFFILIAEKGNWLVIPEILFFKETNKDTYKRAKWEMVGRKLPCISFKNYFSTLIYSFFYHIKAMYDINRSIDILDMLSNKRFKLKLIATGNLMKHYLSNVILRKVIGW